ncbi:hypothetical protein ABEB36_005715 [Hypothenemus hampei]
MLTHSGDIPGQYILTYYTNRNCTKPKGVIDLDRCEQVDLGLKLEKRNLKFDHIFGIKTPSRIYYLAADTEEEMKSWVTCICRVCGLKSANEEEDIGMPMNPDIEITEESVDSKSAHLLESPPISPVSKSPYIPISECTTGKSPVFDSKDLKSLYECNQRTSIQNVVHSNEAYEYHVNNYVNFTQDPDRNYVNDLDRPQFYDFPRQLNLKATKQESQDQHLTPLQSPSYSDVFSEQDLTQHKTNEDTTKNANSSNLSVDVESVATQKCVKPIETQTPSVPPPRPPKPSHINPPCYLNLAPTPIKTRKDTPSKHKNTTARIVSDDMYDFPRSHNLEPEQGKGTLQRRHCYNNAAPTKLPDGVLFRYDISPKHTTNSVTSVFKYDVDSTTQELEPSSPAHSHSSSTPAYSNLPSPMLTEAQMMPPPTVNRDLKPRRKLSDTLSTSSNTEPPSPRNIPGAPSVDRKLKPPTPLQEAKMRKSFHLSEEDGMKRRAAPSPTPPGLMDTYQNQGEVYHYITNHMQYLDLDLDGSSSSGTKKPVTKPNETDTVYKKVDFMKTQAFNLTRNNLEKERQEPVTSFVKK